MIVYLVLLGVIILLFPALRRNLRRIWHMKRLSAAVPGDEGLPFFGHIFEFEIDPQGHDTTSAGMGRAIWCMACNLEIQDRAYREIVEVQELGKTCRACRYSKCLREGMLPRAVQGDLNECRKNGVIGTQPKERKQRQSEESRENEDTSTGEHLTPTSSSMPSSSGTVSTATQTGQDPTELAMEIEALVRRYRSVCDRVDAPMKDTSTSLGNPFHSIQPSTVNVEYSLIYKNPEVVCARTKLDPSAQRIANLDEVLADYKRAFVLYCDLMHATPEVQEMKESDQVTMAEHCLGTFQWTIFAIMALKCSTPVQGICLNNGTYFPLAKELQSFPNHNDLASRAVFYVNGPIRSLALSDAEQAVFSYMGCFIKDIPHLSPAGSKKYISMREKLIRYLHEVCRRWMLAHGKSDDLAVAIRVSRIISLLTSITDLNIRGENDLKVADMLQTVKYDKWMTRRKH